jgi:hypothetical protein
VTDEAMQLAELAGVLQLPVVELAPDGGNADDVVHAVGDVLANPVKRASGAVDERATDAIVRWLAAVRPSDASSRKAHGPSRRP